LQIIQNSNNMKYLLFLSAAALLILVACRSSKKTKTTDTTENTSNEPATLLIEMKKGVCFGRCPVYELSLYSDGRVTYNGIRFSDKMGMHENQIDATRLSAFRQMLSETNPADYPEQFGNEIPDLPSTSLIFHKGAEQKKITWKRNKYDKLKALSEELETLSKMDGWKPTADNTSNSLLINNEIIVHLKKDIDVKQWIRKFGKQELQVKKQIAPNMSIWLLEFNTSAATPDQMLKWIQEDKAVENAEFNKKMEMRR